MYIVPYPSANIMQPQQPSNSFANQVQPVVLLPTTAQTAVQMQPQKPSNSFVVQAQPAVQPFQMVPSQPVMPMSNVIDLQQATIKISLETSEWPKQRAKWTWGSPALAPLQMRGVGVKSGVLLIMD